jgi:hypothetical protein
MNNSNHVGCVSIESMFQNGNNGHLAGLKEALNIIKTKNKEEAIEEIEQLISHMKIQ